VRYGALDLGDRAKQNHRRVKSAHGIAQCDDKHPDTLRAAATIWATSAVMVWWKFS
jgi:hypothetical protein